MPNKNNQGPNDPPYIEEVPGVTVDWDWAGRDGSSNRRRVPPNYFITADNVRLEDGEVQGRKGLTKVNSSDGSDTNCILGITDLPGFATQGRALIFNIGGSRAVIYAPTISKATVYSIDPSGDIFSSTSYVNKYKGRIYTNGREITFRESAGTILAAASELRIYPQPQSGSQFVVAPTASTDPTKAGSDELWFLNSDDVYRWDGSQSYQESSGSDLGGMSTGHVGYLNEQIFVVGTDIAGAANGLYYKDFTGTWNAVAFPAGTNYVTNGITYYNDTALIHCIDEGGASHQGRVLIWDGSSLSVGTSVGEVGTVEIADDGVFDATVFGGNYYYTYGLTNGSVYIGRYNGSTFNDTFVDATSFASTGDIPSGITSLGNSLIIATYNNGGGSPEFYTTSDLSTWTAVALDTAYTGGSSRAFTV